MAEASGYKRRGVDYQIDKPMFTLPGKYYQSESIYAEEQEKIFCKRWQLACREEEVAAAGDFVTVPVGKENIIVVRAENGEIHAHFNVCRHRGTQICDQESGQFASQVIRCPYHAWQYKLDGSLNAAPLMKDIPGFKKQDFGLHAAHVKIWGGFVFINLSEQPQPFEDEMGALDGRFLPHGLPDLRIAHHIPYQLECNWKIILQNYQECYHCPGVHPVLSQWTPFRSAVHDCMDGAVIGGYMQISEPGGSLTMDGKAAGPPLCDVSGEELQRVHYYSVFPNLLLSPHPDFVLYHRIRPIAVNLCVNDCFFLLHPDTIADDKAMERFQSAIEFWDMTNRQDWHVCEQMQVGLASRRFRRGIYSGQEDILFALDQEVLKALGHSAPS